ncbi:hypothetical protein [Algoriphagus limi]|uniref:Glycoside hydrolase family 42 N-terminal domain-containing protein n=1 Tax=Algoriphagus limi TaxID=2975273 RepID=A0ABT2G133_9BACT|nr:hypothetical protein [Algoriphagus limi]MCS5488988.1 hypothetical protein [Algoriphagus limi]
MIDSISCTILDEDGGELSTSNYTFIEIRSDQKFDFSINFSKDVTLRAIWLDVYFSSPITKWRYLDYSWVSPKLTSFVANIHSPKIVKLKSDFLVVPKLNTGCWEYKTPHHLRWFFWHPMLSPTMTYDSKDIRHFLRSKRFLSEIKIENGFLWSSGVAEEWARTPIGFFPTICFTDHSDFDTVQNLKIQREFFKKLGIKTTKGFFLYDYTHKKENASYEHPEGKIELKAWKADGHELAYHALSQSYRGEISEQEFLNFEAPEQLKPIDTYIDHGFHPYNYTKQKLGNWSEWYDHVFQKGIKRIWTYIDGGEANYFNLNQINPTYSTLGHMRLSSKLAKANGLKRNWKTNIRNFLMYGVSEELLQQGKYLGADFRGLVRKKSGNSFLKFLKSGKSFFSLAIKPENIRKQFSKSKEVFEFNRFGPVFFEAPNQLDTKIDAFQTLAVRDYDIAFSKESLERFVKENGLVIAHTYFAYTGLNHEGRLFENEHWDFRPEAKKGFERIGKLIEEGQLWNPTLRDLHSFYQKFEEIEYFLTPKGLKIKNFDGIVREVS